MGQRLKIRCELYLGSRQEAVLAMVEHFVSEVLDNRLSILVEVAEHGVRLPPAHEFDFVVGLVSTHESHGSACSEGASTDVRRRNTSGVLAGGGGTAEVLGDLGSTDPQGVAVVVVGGEDGGEWEGQGSGIKMAAVRHHPPDCGPHWAAEVVATGSKRYRFAFNLVFLGGEVEADRGGSLELGEGRLSEVQATTPQEQTDIGQGESGIIVGGACVFSWAKHEIESQADHIGQRASTGRRCGGAVGFGEEPEH